MTPAHKALAKKLSKPARLDRLLACLRDGRPPWTAGFHEDEALIRETLQFMGVVV